MKITFPLPTDNGTHKYCLTCHADGVKKFEDDGRFRYKCPSCGAVNDRYFHIGNAPQDGKWWVDDDGELWGESAGVFVRNPDGKYLFFERVAYPWGYTIPAGHVDNAETDNAAAAARELKEEVGIEAVDLTEIMTTDIIGDKCGGGADNHRWHLYCERLAEPLDVEVLEKEEGKEPVWMTLEEAKSHELPPVIRYLIENYSQQIDKA